MADLLYIAVMLVFMASCWGLIAVCERLMENKK